MSEFSDWLREHHPRIRYLVKARQCSEKRGGAPVKAFWKRDGTRQDDPEILERWRCKTPAHWKFTALKRDPLSRDGVMCLQHLYHRAIFGTMDELAATERQMVRTGYARPEQTVTQH